MLDWSQRWESPPGKDRLDSEAEFLKFEGDFRGRMDIRLGWDAMVGMATRTFGLDGFIAGMAPDQFAEGTEIDPAVRSIDLDELSGKALPIKYERGFTLQSPPVHSTPALTLATEIERLARDPAAHDKDRVSSAIILAIDVEQLDTLVNTARAERLPAIADRQSLDPEYAAFKAEHYVVAMGTRMLFGIRPEVRDPTSVHRFFSPTDFNILYENRKIKVGEKKVPIADHLAP